jgi:hypothetical protein
MELVKQSEMEIDQIHYDEKIKTKEGLLIAPLVCLIYLNDILSDEMVYNKNKCSLQLELYEYDYTINGIEFEQKSNYGLTNEGF